MSDDPSRKLDFSLPDRPQTKSGGRQAPSMLLVLLLVLVGLNLILTWSRSDRPAPAPHTDSRLDSESLKQLALKLEKQGLGTTATRVWTEYLAAPSTGDDEVSAIWYRIGTLHQEAGSHEEALAAFYRSEKSEGGGDLAADTGRRVQESLEALGKFAALKHELTERVGLDSGSGATSGEVVAEIGPRKITRAEVDRQIEAGIENQLALYAGQVPEVQRKQQKEAMLKQFANDQQRMQFLNQFIMQELLYRKARESKLIDDPAVRAQLRDAERSLLARQFMETELAGKINITDGDLTTYYEANKNRYVDPASAALSHILVGSEEEAKSIIGKILAGEEFAALARDHSLDTGTKENGGALATPARSGQAVPGLAVPPESLKAVFGAKAGDVLDSPVQSDAGWHVVRVRESKDERQQTFEEARTAVYRELRTTKEREVQEQLIEALRDEYDVVIHRDAFGATPPSNE